MGGLRASGPLPQSAQQEDLANETLVGTSPEPLFVVALDGVVRRWNPAATELLRMPATDAIGRRCWAILEARDPHGRPVCRVDCPILAGARQGRSWPVLDAVISRAASLEQHHERTPGRPSDREVRHVTLRHLVLQGHEVAPAAVLHVLEDVSERRRHEDVGRRYHALIEGTGDLTARLTRRERQVFRLVALGLSTREIARRLGIRHTTARNHVQHALNKLDAGNRLAALARLVNGEGAQPHSPEDGAHGVAQDGAGAAATGPHGAARVEAGRLEDAGTVAP